MGSGKSRPVVFGVTGFRHPAVRFAAEEAMLRERPLRVVHGFVWPPFPPSGTPEAYGSPRQDAERIVAEAVHAARGEQPDPVVTGRVVDGDPFSVLLYESRRAALLVLGHGSLRRSVSIPVDSVPVQLCARAECPVIVADDTHRPDAPVVVGVDGSPWMARTLDLAFEEAALRDAPLLIVQAGGTDREAAEIHTLLYDAVASWLARYPEVPVEQQVVAAPATQVLGELSHKAQLLVVGARGWRARLLGSVAQAVLHHAGCPVAVSR